MDHQRLLPRAGVVAMAGSALSSYMSSQPGSGDFVANEIVQFPWWIARGISTAPVPDRVFGMPESIGRKACGAQMYVPADSGLSTSSLHASSLVRALCHTGWPWQSAGQRRVLNRHFYAAGEVMTDMMAVLLSHAILQEVDVYT